MTRWITLLALAWVATAPASPLHAHDVTFSQPRSEPTLISTRTSHPCVYVDRSHNWQFAYDDLADRMLAPVGFDVILCDASLTAVGPLDRFAVVVFQQPWATTRSPQETKLLTEYVEQGGKLLIIAAPHSAGESLAERFGFRMIRGDRASIFACDPLTGFGSPHEVTAGAAHCRLRPAPDQVVLIKDAGGKAVAAARIVARGVVVVWADDGAYWDFCAQREVETMKIASAPTTVSLLRYLVDGRNADREGQVSRIQAENVQQQGSLRYRYSNANAHAAGQLMRQAPTVIRMVEQCNGISPPDDEPFTIHCLSSNGGGWAGAQAVGVCVYGDDPAYPIKVMAHELTHATTGPWPWAFNEAWATIVGIRTADAIGYRASASIELRQIFEQIDQTDKHHNHLDMMASTDDRNNPAYKHKAAWMIFELEKKFGRDFMVRFLALRNQTCGQRKEINLEQTFTLFAQTCGDPNVWRWFQDCGTSIKPPEE